MATSDLLAELSKDSFRAAPDVERKVCAVVLKQLDDQVGGMAQMGVGWVLGNNRGTFLKLITKEAKQGLQYVTECQAANFE